MHHHFNQGIKNKLIFLNFVQETLQIIQILSLTLEYLSMETTTKSNPLIEMEDKCEILMDYRTMRESKNYMVRLRYANTYFDTLL